MPACIAVGRQHACSLQTFCVRPIMQMQVLPLFSNFCTRYTMCQPMLNAVVSNYHYWKGKAPVTVGKDGK